MPGGGARGRGSGSTGPRRRPSVARPEHRRLAVEAVDRAPHVGDAQEVRRVVDQVAGREVVGAVDDEVVALEDPEDVVVVEPLRVHHDLDQRVDLGDRLLRRLRLRPADVGLAVDDLALQVRLVDLVELDDADRPDACRGEVHQRRAAEAAGTDHQHLGVLEPLLPGHPDVGDDQVPAVAPHLVDGELGGRLHERGKGHGALLGRGPGFCCGRRAQHRCRAPCSPPPRAGPRRSRHPDVRDGGENPQILRSTLVTATNRGRGCATDTTTSRGLRRGDPAAAAPRKP